MQWCFRFPTPGLRRCRSSRSLPPSRYGIRPSSYCSYRYRAWLRRASDGMHHGSFFARSPSILLRLAHPSHAWPAFAPPARSVEDSLTRSATNGCARRLAMRAVCRRLTSRARSSPALPCHRRVSSAEPPIRRALRSLRAQLRGPASCRRVAGRRAPPDLRPPGARGSWTLQRVPTGRGSGLRFDNGFRARRFHPPMADDA